MLGGILFAFPFHRIGYTSQAVNLHTPDIRTSIRVNDSFNIRSFQVNVYLVHLT